MGSVLIGLAAVFGFYALVLLACFAVMRHFPASFLGEPAKAVLAWVPPFLGGESLRNWAAAKAGETVRNQLAGKRDAGLATRLTTAIEDGAMRAMLPTVDDAARERRVPCPPDGQGRVGVTAPEALAIAEYIRKHLPLAEQRRIREMAVENARAIAAGRPAISKLPVLPCPLQGHGCMCAVYPARPLRCRPLLAHAVAAGSGTDAGAHPVEASGSQTVAADHEKTVAEGVERGVARALQAAGLDSAIYELNSALVIALDDPAAAADWARGERVFGTPTAQSPGA